MKVFLGVITIGLSYILLGIQLESYLSEAFYPYIFPLSLIVPFYIGKIINRNYKRWFWAWLISAIVPGFIFILYINKVNEFSILPPDILWWDLYIPSSMIIPQILLLLFVSLNQIYKKDINT
jgi:hypothetical protein